jgi:3-(3-hydroxy-phenyl)propionate hydroxylase/6-hydroxy-3-succinoylpyridine 3-monooxygenase
MDDADVIVVGAGPVGLISALGLARSGVRVQVLEAAPEIEDSPRAIVYHWTVLEELDGLGILADVEARGFRKDDYAYRVYATGESIPYSISLLADETPYAYNIHLGQHELAAIALEHLRRLPGTDVAFGARVSAIAQDAAGATVTVETAEGARELRAGWVLGCDGAGSTVRKLLGIPFEGFTWPERFVATNVHYDFERHEGFARATFQIDPVHGAVIVKIDTDGLWRVTYSEDAALPEATVGARVPDHFAALMPDEEPYELERFSPYRMHQRAAARFRDGRVLLAGDAAHATNPTGGLGLTSGLFDAFALREALAAVVLEGADDAVLDRWAHERRRVFVDVTSPAASENKRVLYSEPDPDRRAADLEAIRATVADPDRLRERLKFTERLRTPASALLG